MIPRDAPRDACEDAYNNAPEEAPSVAEETRGVDETPWTLATSRVMRTAWRTARGAPQDSPEAPQGSPGPLRRSRAGASRAGSWEEVGPRCRTKTSGERSRSTSRSWRSACNGSKSSCQDPANKAEQKERSPSLVPAATCSSDAG